MQTLTCGPYTIELFTEEKFLGTLGNREKLAKNPRLAAVKDCTRQVAELLGSHNIPVVLEMNHGGHFQDIPVRIARGTRGISSLMTP